MIFPLVYCSDDLCFFRLAPGFLRGTRARVLFLLLCPYVFMFCSVGRLTLPVLLRQLGLFPPMFLGPGPLGQHLALVTRTSTGSRCCKLDVLGWSRTCELLKVSSPFCGRSSLVPPNERLSCSKSWRRRIPTCSVSYPEAPEPPRCRFLPIISCYLLLQVLNWMHGPKLIV